MPDSDSAAARTVQTTAASECEPSSIWRRLSTPLALLPLFASVGWSLRESPAPPLSIVAERPALIFNEYLIHYGERPVAPQPVVTPTFSFRNVGKETVVLQKLIPSCGCLTPTALVSEIRPGESGQLVLPIRTAGEQPGFHEYTVNVRYTDPQPREVTLAVKLVLPEHSVYVEPRALFLMGRFSEDLEHEVTVTDQRQTPLHVTSVTSSAEWLTPQIVRKQRDAEGSQTVVGVRVTSDVPVGNQRALIHVSTSDSQYSVLQVPVVIRVRERDTSQPVLVRPELVNLEAGTGPRNRGSVEVSFPTAWKLHRIDSFPDELQTEFQELPEEVPGLQRIRVMLSLSQLPSARLQHGVVSIMANEGRETISVPLQFVWPLAGVDSEVRTE